MNETAYPSGVLSETLLEMQHPVAKTFEGVRGQTAPDIGDLAVEERPRDVVKLAAHTHFTFQSLESQNRERAWQKY